MVDKGENPKFSNDYNPLAGTRQWIEQWKQNKNF